MEDNDIYTGGMPQRNERAARKLGNMLAQAPGAIPKASGRKGMTLQHSASSAAHNIDAYRNSQPLGNITTEPKYPHPLTTNNRDGPTGVNHSQQVGSYDLKKNKDMRLPG